MACWCDRAGLHIFSCQQALKSFIDITSLAGLGGVEWGQVLDHVCNQRERVEAWLPGLSARDWRGLIADLWGKSLLNALYISQEPGGLGRGLCFCTICIQGLKRHMRYSQKLFYVFYMNHIK